MLKKIFATEITEERTFLVLTLLTGILAGITAVSLKFLIHHLTNYLGTGTSFDLLAFILGGVAILISGHLTTRFFPSTEGSGIPGVKISLAVHHGKIPFQNTVAKFFVSILSLSSGLSLGREGPTVTIASGIGSALGSFFNMPKKKVKALVAIGAAGGISAAFYTPISAVIFTLEEIVGDLNAKILGPIIVSSVLAAVTAQYITGERATFTQIYYQLGSFQDLFYYFFLGIICSLLGVLWVKNVLFLRETLRKIFRGHRLTVIFLTFLVIGLVSHYTHYEILGSGHHLLDSVLKSFVGNIKFVFILFILKFFATSLSYSSGVSGGLFMPTLLIGGIIGTLWGQCISFFQPDLAAAGNLGAFALVGMGAFFAAVIRAPFTSILMIFELTRDYNIMLPLMLANITAYVIAERIHKGSVYESISEQDGVHLPTREDHDVLESMIVEDAMVVEVVSINGKLSVSESLSILDRNKSISGYPVIQGGVLIGMIARSEILKAFAREEKERPVREIAQKKIISVYPDQSLLVALHKLKRHGISRLPVVSRINNRNILGIITPENIVEKFGLRVTPESDS